MKKYIILLLLVLSFTAEGQTKSYKGFYHAKFFNVLGEVKIIEADFEVQENNSIVGKLKVGAETKILQGAVESKGKFEAQAAPENGVVTLIKGELPISREGKVSFIIRREEKRKDGKSTSETGLSGFIEQVSPPAELKDIGIADNGKTQLLFQHSKPLFGKAWNDFPATVKPTNYQEKQEFEIKMELETREADREFSFRISIPQNGQKIWRGKELSDFYYSEDNKHELNLFNGSNDDLLSGQVEITGESENEMIFKITNLQIKNSNNSLLQVDGYIHADKIK